MVALAPVGATYEKTTHDIEAVKARNAIVIAVATRGDEAIRALADYTIFVPPASAWMQPFLVTLALQLFAYHMACIRGRDWPVADTPFERNRSVFPLEPAEDREVIHRE